MDRRRFLSTAAAAPCVWGLDELFAQENAGPEWLAAAKARMRETGRWGLVLIVPAERSARLRMGRALQTLILSPDPTVHEILCEAVFVCLDEDLAAAAGLGKPGVNRILWSPDAKTLASDAIALDVLETPAAFAASFRPFIHGPDRIRLKERAAALRAALPPELVRALDPLDPAALSGRVDGLVPLLVHARLASRRPEERAELERLIERHYAQANPASPGPRLPFGCGGPRKTLNDVRPCFACGLGSAPAESRTFLGFLTR